MKISGKFDFKKSGATYLIAKFPASGSNILWIYNCISFVDILFWQINGICSLLHCRIFPTLYYLVYFNNL